MGKLYDAIKRDYENIRKFKELEKTNFLESRKFENYDRAIMAQARINKYLKTLEAQGSESLSKDGKSFKEILKGFEDIIGKGNETFPELDFKADQFYDCEPILNKLEEEFSELFLHDFTTDDDVIENQILNPDNQFLNDKTNSIRVDMANLNIKQEELSREERSELLGFLGEISKQIIIKPDGDILDKEIDDVAKANGVEARNRLEEFANKNGYDKDILKSSDQGMGVIGLYPETNAQSELLKNITNQELELTQEYKNKLLALDNLVTKKNILNDALAGESDHKEYGFNEWFNKATEVKEAVLKYSTIKFDQRDAKIDCLKEILARAREFKEINEKYDEIMQHIEENFDINKISLPANVYSGRNHPFDDIKTFKPDLPRKYDYENAPYGVVLNGYVQLKKFCNDNNIALKDFLDNPTKEYKKAAFNYVKQIDKKYALPKENNTLGKRMARALIQVDGDLTKKIATFIVSSRSLEFVIQTQDQNEKSVDNYIIGDATSNSVHMLRHTADKMFNNEKDEPDYQSLKNLFARGEDVDNLFTLSKNYRDENLNLVNDVEHNYDNSVKGKNPNALTECNRVLKTINDFLVERKYMDDHEEEIADGAVLKLDAVNPSNLLAAGREYFKDYIEKNNINILDIPNKADRNKVLEFLNDPAKAFQNKYKKERDIFINRPGKNESFNTFKNDVKEELNKIYKTDKNIENDFALNNQKENGYNTGKNISTILNDNKGGFFERYIFRNTSKEYKALENAVKAATSPNSSTCGDYSQAKVYALKYLDHKLPEGVNEDNLSATSKKRIEFCRSFLRTFDALPKKYEEPQLITDEVNKEVAKEPLENAIDKKVAIDNNDFQKDLNNNLEEANKDNNNNIIQNDNEKDEIEL